MKHYLPWALIAVASAACADSNRLIQEEVDAPTGYRLIDEQVYDAPIKTQVEQRLVGSLDLSVEDHRGLLRGVFRSV